MSWDGGCSNDLGVFHGYRVVVVVVIHDYGQKSAGALTSPINEDRATHLGRGGGVNGERRCESCGKEAEVNMEERLGRGQGGDEMCNKTSSEYPKVCVEIHVHKVCLNNANEEKNEKV